MAKLNAKQIVPVAQAQPGDPVVAQKLALGLTLVPYWGRSDDGRRIACCAWIRLRPGESVSEAATRLNQLHSPATALR